jgi:oxygen-dependent protoporphyrinogen oxidase
MKRVVIIGGGISGLSTAYFLKEEAKKTGADISIKLIEKNDRLGGNIMTERVDNFIIEGGPDCFISDKPWALQLCRKLGLSDRISNTNTIEGSTTFVLSKGKLQPLPEGFILMIPTKIMPFLFNSLISVHGKLRMALDLVKPKGDPNKDVSLGEFVNRRLGKEAMEKIAEPLVAGVHAGNPETMSLKSSFPRFLDMEQKYGSLILGMLKARSMAKKMPKKEGPKLTMFMTLKGGLVELVDAIIKNLDKESILTGKTILNIDKKPNGAYVLNIEGEGPIETDYVVFSTPAFVTAKLIKNLDQEMAEKLENIPYVSTATVSLAFKKSEIKSSLKGFGFVIPRLEKRKIMAATWTSIKFPNRAPDDSILIRCFVGGSKNEELSYMEPEEMIKMVRNELKEIVGIDAEPILARVFKWDKAMPQYVIGHCEIIKWLDERIKQHPGFFLTGSAYKGVGLSDSVHNGEITASDVLKFND